ncbi:hypothetical protein [Kribbella sp. DT2]|uniref:hypothetical protein n=1 Tax=Kribbella sp. DT2 TaxID=3393427 RepID=UPI003CE94295
MSDHLWYPELIKSIETSSHLFLHYSAFHRVDENGETIAGELRESGHSPAVVAVRQGARFEVDSQVDVVILLGMEKLHSAHRSLERLRVDVNDWISATAGRVLVVSRSPRSVFPVGDGSSLVLDSRDVHLKESRLADWVLAEYQATHGTIPAEASICRGLAARLGGSTSMEASTDDFEAVATAVAADTILELGASYVAWLDHWVIDERTTEVPLVDVPEWMQAELINAGVASIDLDQENLMVFRKALGSSWLRGLKIASRRCVSPPRDWAEISAGLFEIERLLRQAMARALEQSLGRKWAVQALADDQLNYVRTAAGLESSRSLTELANPLDFLTLGQLIDLIDGRRTSAPIGLSPETVSDLRRLLPIRNRVGHMRLPKAADLPVCRAMLRIVRTKLEVR